MSELSLDALLVAATLLPGFLSSKIKDFFIPARKLTAFDHFMEVAAFAVANYVTAAVVLGLGRRDINFVRPLCGVGEQPDSFAVNVNEAAGGGEVLNLLFRLVLVPADSHHAR